MATAYRTVIEVVVFSPEPMKLDDMAEGDLYDPLQKVIGDAYEGDKIGDWRVVTQDEPIEGAALRQALVDIGNDGAFFDDDK